MLRGVGSMLLTRCIGCAPGWSCTVRPRRECRFDPGRREGYRTQSDPSSVEDGVCEGCSHGCRRGLASAKWWQCWSVKKGHLDSRDFWEGQNRIAHPVHAGDAGAIERYFLVKCAAERLHNRSFDLVAQPIGIDHQAAVVRTCNTPYADLATRRVNHYVHRHGDVILTVLVPRIRYTTAGKHVVLPRLRIGRGPRLPAEHLRGAFEHVDSPRIREPTQTEGDRVGTRRRCQLVSETFHGENIGDF